MVLEETRTVINSMLTQSILTVCRKAVPYDQEFSVEGRLHITIDKKDVVLVNVKDTVHKGDGFSPGKRKRNLKKKTYDEDVDDNNYDDDTDYELFSSKSDSPVKKRTRKRGRPCRATKVAQTSATASDSVDNFDTMGDAEEDDDQHPGVAVKREIELADSLVDVKNEPVEEEEDEQIVEGIEHLKNLAQQLSGESFSGEAGSLDQETVSTFQIV